MPDFERPDVYAPPAPPPSRVPSPPPNRSGGGGGGASATPTRRSGRVTADDVRLLYNVYLGREPTQEDLDIHMFGGFRNDPAGLEQSIANSPEALAFNARGAGGGGGGLSIEDILGMLEGFGQPSEAEQHYLDLLGQQIEAQLGITKEQNEREKARRAFLNDQIKQKYGISLEEFESQEALRSAQISRQQSERLQKALAGELEVDPAIESQITEESKNLHERLLQQLGPGYETSTPGIQSLAEFQKNAAQLRSAARHDILQEGISPAVAAQQYGLNLIGEQQPTDTTSLAQALQAAQNQRQSSLQAAQLQLSGLLSMRQLQNQLAIANQQAGLDRQRLSLAYPTQTSGRGAGALAGSLLGAAATTVLGSGGSYFQNRRSIDPLYT